MKRGVFLLFGLLHPALGILLAGAGHGWVTGMLFSFFSMIVFVTLALFGTENKLFCSSLIVLNTAAAASMIFKTREEGVTYIIGVWNSVRPVVAVYALLWFSWLVIPVLSLLRNKIAK